MGSPTTLQVALACGVAGAFVDVSDDLRDSMSRTWGKQDDFDDLSPGTFTFVLSNASGKYTPDNPSSSLATRLTEGMDVSWLLNDRLVMGKVNKIDPYFRSTISTSAMVKVTCYDMLGDAARYDLNGSTIAEAAVFGASPFMYWPMDDEPGSTEIAEKSGNNQLPLSQFKSTFSTNIPPAFGTPGVAGVGGTQASFVAPGFSSAPVQQAEALVGGPAFVAEYPVGSLGAWGFWFTPTASPTAFDLYWFRQSPFNGSPNGEFKCITLASGMVYSGPFGTGSGPVSSPALAVGVPHYFSCETVLNTSTNTATSTAYMDGVAFGTHTITYDGRVNVLPHDVSQVTVSGRFFDIQHLSHTATLVNEDALVGIDLTTEAGWLTALGNVSPSVQLETLPADLSTAPIGPVDFDDVSHLDLLNDVIDTEQGYLYPVTTGTLLAPVQKLRVRARDRPSDVKCSFDVLEIKDAPEFVRDITNMVASVSVRGIGASVVVADATLTKKVGNANTSESILNSDPIDLRAFGEDRLNRGQNSAVRIPSFVVNAFTTPTDRWADLLALELGDRIRVTGLPAAQLGFSTWDGWYLGGPESHEYGRNYFTIRLAPTLAESAVYDDVDYRFMAGGFLSLTSSINASATTISVATPVGGPLLETVDVPFDLIIENEQVTVTACTSGTPQVATIIRGVNGTTATSHIYVGTQVEVAVPSLYAF